MGLDYSSFLGKYQYSSFAKRQVSLNSFIFLLFREFSNERLRVERRANFYRTRSKNQFNESFGRYLSWITDAGFVILNTKLSC